MGGHWAAPWAAPRAAQMFWASSACTSQQMAIQAHRFRGLNLLPEVSINWWLSTRAILLSRGYQEASGDILVVTVMGQGTTGIQWGEARDAARHPTLCMTDTPSEELPKVSIAPRLRSLKQSAGQTLSEVGRDWDLCFGDVPILCSSLWEANTTGFPGGEKVLATSMPSMFCSIRYMILRLSLSPKARAEQHLNLFYNGILEFKT